MRSRWLGFGISALVFALLTGCQSNESTQSTKSKEISFSSDTCEEFKNARNYNTAEGRTSANMVCSKRTFPDSKSHNIAFWREYSRQRKCEQETGKLCED